MRARSTADPCLLALDLGIASIKAALFRPDGTLVAIQDSEYLHISELETFVEVDPEAYWQATCTAIGTLIEAASISAASIVALSISSHGETLFCLDASGRPVRAGILTLDARAEEEAKELAVHMGQDRVFRLTGQPEVLPIWPAAKIAWLRGHERVAYARTRHFLLPQSYILFRLCGEFVDDPSVQTTTLLLDINTLHWSQPLLDFAGIVPGQLPFLASPGTAVGELSARAAADTGLSEHTHVVVGALDQLCAALGAGNICPGILTESTGSVLALVTTTRHATFLAETPAPCYPHVLPGIYCLLPWHQTGGLVLKWFTDRFAGEGMAGGKRYEALMREAVDVPPGCDGLIMLPHLAGAQFPEANPAARGVFFGVSLKHGRGHFARAILEAIAFMIRHDIEALRALGIDNHEIISLGGGAKSDLWLQIKADVCHLPIKTLHTPQAALLGAAILAGVGAEIHSDVPMAVDAMSHPGIRREPRPQYAAVYDRCFAKFTAIYQRVADLF